MSTPPPIRADLAHRDAARAKRARGWVLTAAIGIVLAGGLVILFAWRSLFADLPTIPPEAELWALNRPPGVTFLDRTGAVIATRGFRHGSPVRLADLPPYLPRAFLAAEDRRFRQHPGVDAQGLLRALAHDLKARRAAEGGSTLTQQLVRGLFLSPEQTPKRKVQEAVLALELERRIPKDRILELYLNRTYLGAGAYGVEAAARAYFGRSARELTLAQSALLAALPKAPTRLDPTNDLAAARARAGLVLAAMRREGWASPDGVAEALAHPAELAPENRTEGEFGYVLDRALAEAKPHVGAHPDLVIHLTIDPRLQPLALQAVRSAVAEARGRGGTEAALVALAPDGGVLALAGGLDHRESPFDRATQALRQPGSAFKPIVYATALAEGLHAGDVRQDAPIDIHGWRPQNAGGGYAGAVTLGDALARSINTIAVRLTQEVGVERMARMARAFGLSTIPPHPAPPVALGAYEVRLIELVGAYQAIQGQGLRRPVHLVQSVTDARGEPIWRPDPTGWRVLAPGQAIELTAMMQGVIERGTGREAALGRPAAGKTGTTSDYRDAWFVGFTPDIAAGVWLGDDRGRPMDRMVGGEAPARAWARFMLAAHEGLPIRDFASKPGAADARTEFYTRLAGELEDGAPGDGGE